MRIKHYILTFLLVCGLSLTIEFLCYPPQTKVDAAAAVAYVTSNNLAIPPQNFIHDGCTLFIDVLPYHDFRPGCLNHDIAYWAGGDIHLKNVADVALYDAIYRSGPLGFIFAPAMYYAVEYLGDSPLTRAVHAQWGYGWDIH